MADDDKAKDDSKRDDTKRDDADAGKQLKSTVMDAIADAMKPFADAFGKRMDEFGKRMDAYDDGRKDAKRDDADEDEDEPKGDAKKDAKADAKRDDAKRDDDKRDDARRDAKRDDARRDAKKDDKDPDEDDPKGAVADKSKKDAKRDDADEDKDRDDARKDARADDVGDLRKRLDELSTRIPKAIGDSDYHAMTDAQARADDVFALFGERAPRPLAGQTPAAYERNCVRKLKAHSPRWSKVDENSAAFADDAVFGQIRDQVYADAAVAARAPTSIPEGQLREVTRREGGHEVREFHGNPRIWMDPMAGAAKQYVTAFNTPRSGQQH